jgi:serine protease
VVAAGNTRYLSGWGASVPQYQSNIGFISAPGNSDHDVITVGASTNLNTISWYSPISEMVDIVAPSGATVASQFSTHASYANSLNVWTTDDLDSLGFNPTYLTDNYVPKGSVLPSDLAYTGRFTGISAATPMVAGVAALVLSVNPCLTNTQVRDILLHTADKVGGYDYDWSITKPGHSKEMGYGKVNAHKAVLVAQAMSSSTLDLIIKDVPNDFGAKPDTVAKLLYVSDDIWLRNQQDGRTNQFHEPPEYDPTQPVYIYVRVRNNSCVDATPADSVSIYWAKASTGLAWRQPWDGSVTNPLMGDSLSTLSVGNLKAGKDTILEIPWIIPNPQNYAAINNDIWHFCLLARVKSTIDTMTFQETNALWQNVKNNNNIAWKNVTVVDNNRVAQTPNEEVHGLGEVIGFGNHGDEAKDIKLVFRTPNQTFQDPITEVAEVSILLDAQATQLWEQAGFQQTGLLYEGNGLFRVQSNEAILEGFNFDAGETATLFVGFNFLTEEVDQKTVFRYYAEQYEGETIVGGEEFFIHTDERPLFYADAGLNQSVNQGQAVQLFAQEIGEPAQYHWYDENGDLFYTGTDTSFIPAANQKFVLEIIAEKDGYKDYDEKEIQVKEHYIQSVSPNPQSAGNPLTINYQTTTSGQVQLVVQNQLSNAYHIFSASNANTQTTINTNSLISGTYLIKMLVDGVVVDSKTFILN